MSYSIKLAWVNILRRKKQTVGNVLLLTLTLLIVFASLTATYSIHYFTDVAINSAVDYKTLWVDCRREEPVETSLKKLKAIDHVQTVFPQVYSGALPSNVGDTDGSYWIEYNGAVRETLPSIVQGRGFETGEEWVAVIPENFRLETYVEEGDGATRGFSGGALLGKTLRFPYGKDQKTVSFTVIGTYDNEASGEEYRDVFVPYEALRTLQQQREQSDVDDVARYTVIADSYEQVRPLETLINENYSEYDAVHVTGLGSLPRLRDFLDIFTRLLIGALSVFVLLNVLMTVMKSVKLRMREIGLYKAVGYSNRKICRLQSLEMLLISCMSLIGTAAVVILAAIVVKLFETDLNAFLDPLKLVTTPWIALVTLLIGVLLPQLGCLLAFPKIVRISPANALHEL